MEKLNQETEVNNKQLLAYYESRIYPNIKRFST